MLLDRPASNAHVRPRAGVLGAAFRLPLWCLVLSGCTSTPRGAPAAEKVSNALADGIVGASMIKNGAPAPGLSMPRHSARVEAETRVEVEIFGLLTCPSVVPERVEVTLLGAPPEKVWIASGLVSRARKVLLQGLLEPGKEHTFLVRGQGGRTLLESTIAYSNQAPWLVTLQVPCPDSGP